MATETLSPGQQGKIKRLVDEPLPELTPDEEEAQDAAFVNEGEFYPQRWYTAGSGSHQERILMKGGKILEPQYGFYVIHTPEERTVLLSALAGRIWKENLDPEEEDLTCTRRGCDMRTRSTRAFNVHVSRNHPQN